ncbi:class F sortase [Catenulispora yoronensis]|uniref:Class F sortase n=1 Tax=Catenulispora yoronensis TaxID=450799 RepID=A0ABN2TMD6_9ACTN
MSGDPAPAAGPGRAGPPGRRRTLKVVLAVAVVLAGFRLLSSGVSALTGPPSPSRGALFGSWSGPSAPPLARSVPLRVKVPSVGIDAPLIRLGLDADGAVAVPPTSVPTEAGWFIGNPTPGERGAAVIVGHVDTEYGRAVFYPLGNVQPGALVVVDRADKKHAQFRVNSVEVVDKGRFPAQRVYGSGDDSDGAQLRLITCGGAFDGKHYADNLVVYAQLVGVSD